MGAVLSNRQPRRAPVLRSSTAEGGRSGAPYLRAAKPWLVSAAILLTLAGVFVARTAFARITRNTIDPVAIVTDRGRHIDLTGPLAVTAGERVVMRVTVTQRTTGGVAEGYTSLTGNGTTNQWELRATTFGRAAFEPGPATAVAIAVTHGAQHRATDAHQWLVNLTLVEE